MKKILFISAIFSLLLFSCMSTMAGMLNSKLIETNSDEYVSKKLKNVESLNLNEQQKKQSIAIYTNEIEALKKNAEKEKKGELNNSMSGKLYVYEIWKSQIEFEKILDKDQLIKFKEGIYNGKIEGNDEKQMAELKKYFNKIGLKTDL